MIRAVVDTNLLVSYLLTHRQPIATLIDRHLWREHLILVSAVELVEELDRVLQYPRLQRTYTETERRRFLALVLALSETVELPDEIPAICRDPDDDRVIACAVAGRADVIVSGDHDLLALERVGKIPIVTAARFLEMLGRMEQVNGE